MFLLSPTTVSHMCYLIVAKKRKSLNNIPRSIALRLRLIIDTEEKFNSRSIEYKNYLIARDFKPYQSLNELLAPSLYPNNKASRANSVTSCNKCEIC